MSFPAWVAYYLFYKMPLINIISVYDALNGWTRGTLANAETICSTNRIMQFYDLCFLSFKSTSPALPSISSDRIDSHDRTVARCITITLKWQLYTRWLFVVTGVSGQTPVFATSDVVPFRLTPNMQHFLGPIFTEGLLTSGIMSIGRSLTEPEVKTYP